jgi:hypothetical protein
MGIFRIEKKNLNGETVEVMEFPNTILDTGLEYLCAAPGNDFNIRPHIAVGASDVTPDTNQKGLIQQIMMKDATFTAGTSTGPNPNGNKQFIATANFASNEAVGELTEISYIMATASDDVTNPIPLNRTLFQVAGALDTRFSATPELDQIQNTDISNVSKIFGTTQFSQSFTTGTGVVNLSEIALSLASSGAPAVPLQIQLCADAAGVPGAVLGTTVIAQFAEPVQRWRIGSFASPVVTTAATKYHIVVSATGTDTANAYRLFGSSTDQYAGGALLLSTNSGTSYAPVAPAQDAGFKTYTSVTGATTHDYVLTAVQFDTETAQSADFTVTAFPENNLDSTNTSQGTVRLSLPTYVELPPYTKALKLYKKVGAAYNLLATLGDIRQYFYDNGTVTPDITHNPPAATSPAAPVGLAATIDSTQGGPLNSAQDRYYKVSALQYGPVNNAVTVGPFINNSGVISPPPFYTSPYSSINLPIAATEYETAGSTEYHLVAPTINSVQFKDYFTGPTLDPILWSFTNNNTDYFTFVKPASTNENQLQLNVPQGVPFVIASKKQARAAQTYYVNVSIPWLNLPKPFTIVNSGGVSSTNPIYTDGAANRVPVFSFLNPNNINTFNNDKRLTLEVGFYHNYRTEDQTTLGDVNPYAHGPQWCLYDNLGNTYFFAMADIPSSHSDGAYTFKIDIGPTDRSLKISVLDPIARTFKVITSSLNEFDFHTQLNGSHVLANGGHPGPATQTTNHFQVPENYSFAIGNPSNDALSFVPPGTAYVSVGDSIYTITGITPSVPVPAISMISSGYHAVMTWTPVLGARRYRLYSTISSGVYGTGQGSLVTEYETYYPAYAVQSTATADGNDWFNSIAGAGTSIRNWQDIGVTYGFDATSTGTTNCYGEGGFIGSLNGSYGGPTVPTIAGAPGSAEGYLLLLTGIGQHAMFTFMGGGFELVGETGPDRGIASIYIDGNYVQDIDFYSADRKEQVSVFTTNVLTPGFHTVKVYPKALGGALQANDFSLGYSIPLDYFRITLPAVVDGGNVSTGAPVATNDSHIATVPPPSIKGSRTYNGNGPTVVVKDPQHTLSVTMTFSLINPNL